MISCQLLSYSRNSPLYSQRPATGPDAPNLHLHNITICHRITEQQHYWNASLRIFLSFLLYRSAISFIITLHIAAYIFTIYTTLIHNQMTYQSHLQAVCSLLSQYILSILLNPKFHYLIHKSPPLVPSLSQINSVHSVPSQLFKVHFNIILPPNLRSTKCCISFRFPHQNIVCIFLITMRATCSTHLILLMCWGTQYLTCHEAPPPRNTWTVQASSYPCSVLLSLSLSRTPSLLDTHGGETERTLLQKTAVVEPQGVRHLFRATFCSK